MCCMRTAENNRMQKFAICAPSHNIVRLHIFATKAYINNPEKKHVKQQYLLHISSQYGELGPLMAGISCPLSSFEHPSKFERVSGLGFVTALTSLNGGLRNFARCFAVSRAGTLCIHFGGLLSGAKFTFRPSLAFSYVGSVTARHSSSGRQPNFEA